MKKSIIYFSFVLAAIFSNDASALTTYPANAKSLTTAAEITRATPLAHAIVKGDVVAVKKFIGYGIDINEKSNDMTPLMIAARYNQVEIINLLLENGANLKTINTKGFTALKYAQLSNAQQATYTITEALKS